MKIGAGGIAALGITLVMGVGFGGFLHVFVIDLNGNLAAHAVVWGLLLLGGFRLWRAVRFYRSLDDEAPTRQLAEDLPSMLERMKKERESAAADAARASETPPSPPAAPPKAQDQSEGEQDEGPATQDAASPSPDGDDRPPLSPS